MTIDELRRVVELIRHRGDQQQAKLLEQWLKKVLIDYGDRVLSPDCDAAQLWGRLRVPNPQHGIDKQIAAIALFAWPDGRGTQHNRLRCLRAGSAIHILWGLRAAASLLPGRMAI